CFPDGRIQNKRPPCRQESGYDHVRRQLEYGDAENCAYRLMLVAMNGDVIHFAYLDYYTYKHCEANMNVKDIFLFVGPVIAGLASSYLTYYFAIQSKRKESILKFK